jgi:hypothetical protein
MSRTTRSFSRSFPSTAPRNSAGPAGRRTTPGLEERHRPRPSMSASCRAGAVAAFGDRGPLARR